MWKATSPWTKPSNVKQGEKVWDNVKGDKSIGGERPRYIMLRTEIGLHCLNQWEIQTEKSGTLVSRIQEKPTGLVEQNHQHCMGQFFSWNHKKNTKHSMDYVQGCILINLPRHQYLVLSSVNLLERPLTFIRKMQNWLITLRTKSVLNCCRRKRKVWSS